MPGLVTNPTAGDVHVNTPLTNFSQKWLQDQAAFVALRAFPNAPVTKQSDLYFNFSRADFFRDEAKERADGTESQGGGFTLSTDPYFARVYAFHKDVTDRQRANQDTVIRLDQSATQFVSQKLMLRREIVFQEAFINTGIWDTNRVGVASSPTGDQFISWTETASDPIIDFRTSMRTMQGLTGFRPNKAVFGRSAWDTLLDNEAVLARIQQGATTAIPAIVMRSLIAALFELEEIFVMDSVVNTGLRTDPETETTAFIADDVALLYFAPSGVAVDQPTAGAQFSWTGFMGATDAGMRIKRFRNELTESDRIEGQMAFDYRVTSSELGIFFSNIRN